MGSKEYIGSFYSLANLEAGTTWYRDEVGRNLSYGFIVELVGKLWNRAVSKSYTIQGYSRGAEQRGEEEKGKDNPEQFYLGRANVRSTGSGIDQTDGGRIDGLGSLERDGSLTRHAKDTLGAGKCGSSIIGRKRDGEGRQSERGKGKRSWRKGLSHSSLHRMEGKGCPLSLLLLLFPPSLLISGLAVSCRPPSWQPRFGRRGCIVAFWEGIPSFSLMSIILAPLDSLSVFSPQSFVRNTYTSQIYVFPYVLLLDTFAKLKIAAGQPNASRAAGQLWPEWGDPKLGLSPCNRQGGINPRAICSRPYPKSFFPFRIDSSCCIEIMSIHSQLRNNYRNNNIVHIRWVSRKEGALCTEGGGSVPPRNSVLSLKTYDSMHPAPSCLPLAYIRHYGKRHCVRIYTVYFLFLPAFCEDCLQAGSKRATALADRKRRPEGGCKFLHGNLVGENYLHFVPWTREENRQTGGRGDSRLTTTTLTTTQPHNHTTTSTGFISCAVPLQLSLGRNLWGASRTSIPNSSNSLPAAGHVRLHSVLFETLDVAHRLHFCPVSLRSIPRVGSQLSLGDSFTSNGSLATDARVLYGYTLTYHSYRPDIVLICRLYGKLHSANMPLRTLLRDTAHPQLWTFHYPADRPRTSTLDLNKSVRSGLTANKPNAVETKQLRYEYDHSDLETTPSSSRPSRFSSQSNGEMQLAFSSSLCGYGNRPDAIDCTRVNLLMLGSRYLAVHPALLIRIPRHSKGGSGSMGRLATGDSDDRSPGTIITYELPEGGSQAVPTSTVQEVILPCKRMPMQDETTCDKVFCKNCRLCDAGGGIIVLISQINIDRPFTEDVPPGLRSGNAVISNSRKPGPRLSSAAAKTYLSTSSPTLASEAQEVRRNLLSHSLNLGSCRLLLECFGHSSIYSIRLAEAITLQLTRAASGMFLPRRRQFVVTVVWLGWLSAVGISLEDVHATTATKY
ncbi:hypothetical protein CCUS01_01820 [Colletotrichum cuscutae]|uniref:Uncharacterized protein n=1 Tax=Colletotrichum cuscutae TaxID=1209917 RepID=A0AAI9UJZ6_9PEZI|nr:hypothetical protein CCUS01_01820 [Colletotrichum cuscutae]